MNYKFREIFKIDFLKMKCVSQDRHSFYSYHSEASDSLFFHS